MNVKVMIAAGGVVLTGAAVVLVLRGSGQEENVPSGRLERVVRVERGDLDLTVSADGVVQPINKVEVKSKASGQILELNLVEGEEVRQGDLLVALDQTTAINDADQAKADLEVAEANAAQQENNDRRSEELVKKNLISQQEYDQAHVEYVRAKANLVKARAVLSSAEERLRDTRIRAPISGIVLTKNVEIGQIISSGVSNVGGGTVLATLADMQKVYVETNVDEVDIGRVQIGQRAVVHADAFADDSFPGEVVRLAPLGKTQQNVTVFTVIVQVINRGGKLKAGMSASVDIEIFRRSHVLLLPNDALHDPKSDEGREMMARLSGGSDASAVRVDSISPSRTGGSEGWRERLASLTPEERAALRERFMRRTGEAGSGEGRRSGEDRIANRLGSDRPASPSGQEPPRRRLVRVKEGEQFVPRLVMTGPNNYDNTEIVSGLSEGDEVLETVVSRARIAADQFQERLRSRQSMGGMGGGPPR
jgi:HlyD family secretion protein